MDGPRIRVAAADDLAAIDAIYHHYVAHATCTWQYAPSPPAERRAWLDAHDDKHPITVAVDADGEIVGWGSLSVYNEREGYRFTVEDTVRSAITRSSRASRRISRRASGCTRPPASSKSDACASSA